MAAIDLYLARRSRTTGLLNGLNEGIRPLDFQVPKNVEGSCRGLEPGRLLLGRPAHKNRRGRIVSSLARANICQKLIGKSMAKAVSDFVRVASTSEIPEGKMKKAMVGGQQVLVSNVKGKYYAIGNVCTHMGGPLDQGLLGGHEVECPWHGSHFDVTNGQVKRGPAARPEPVYDLKVEAGSILVRPKQ